MIKEPQRSVPEDSINIRGYIYMKIKIYVAFNRRDFTIYQDIRTGRALVSHIFLINFSDVDIIKVFKLAKIIGYLGLVIKF